MGLISKLMNRKEKKEKILTPSELAEELIKLKKEAELLYYSSTVADLSAKAYFADKEEVLQKKATKLIDATYKTRAILESRYLDYKEDDHIIAHEDEYVYERNLETFEKQIAMAEIILSDTRTVQRFAKTVSANFTSDETKYTPQPEMLEGLMRVSSVQGYRLLAEQRVHTFNTTQETKEGKEEFLTSENLKHIGRVSATAVMTQNLPLGVALYAANEVASKRRESSEDEKTL